MAHPFERLRYVARGSSAGAAAIAVGVAPALGALAGDPGALLTSCRRLLDFHPDCGPLWWLCAHVLAADDTELAAAFAAAELEEDITSSRLEELLGERRPQVVVALGAPGENLAPGLAAVAAAAAGSTAATGVTEDELYETEDELYETEDELYETEAPAPATLGDAVPASAAPLIRLVRRSWVPSDLVRAVDGADLVLLDVLAAGPAGVIAPAGGARLAHEAARASVPCWAVGGVGKVLPEPLFRLAVERLDGGNGNGAGAAGAVRFSDRVAELVGAAELAGLVGPAGASGDVPAALRDAGGCPVPIELLRRAR